MKATIKKLNGDVIELEGTAEEIKLAIGYPEYYYPIGPITIPWNPPVMIPQFQIVSPCAHEYPNPWMGVTSPACVKCGVTGPVVGTWLLND